jgi:hypothetical protein
MSSQGRILEVRHPRGLRREQERSQEAPSCQEPRSCQVRAVGHNSLQEARSSPARVVGHNSLQEARSCQALAEGSQVSSHEVSGSTAVVETPHATNDAWRPQIHPPDPLTYPRDQTHTATRALRLLKKPRRC